MESDVLRQPAKWTTTNKIIYKAMKAEIKAACNLFLGSQLHEELFSYMATVSNFLIYQHEHNNMPGIQFMRAADHNLAGYKQDAEDLKKLSLSLESAHYEHSEPRNPKDLGVSIPYHFMEDRPLTTISRI